MQEAKLLFEPSMLPQEPKHAVALIVVDEEPGGQAQQRLFLR
tara:strand:+ start:596 stop:721 length:126 start_codon:yes stop_codon:yes gene_type:complete